jgi:small subunit ribosomal protein S19e
MTDIKSKEPHKYNKNLAEALKKLPEFHPPEWIDFVKTSAHKLRPTSEQDFWHKRSASILRQIYVKEIVGVNRLRSRYGGRKKRGVKPSEFRKAGGKIIRTILQQAEKAGLIEKAKQGKKSGRKLTQKGKEFLEHLGEK